ncbi:MAG: aminotransferase class V-fold PLP-dependent enzyme [Mycobacteriales bacterium]
MTVAALATQRELFDIPRDVAYLNCSYMAPQLRSVTEAGLVAVRAKASPWHVSATDFFTQVEQLRAAFAGLIGADVDAVSLVPAVSYGVATAAANLPIARGQTVVTLAEQFPSNVYGWRAAAQQAGGSVVTVPRPPDGDWTRELLAAIDDRTAVVAVPHCHWTDGSMVDLVRVGEAVRATGAGLVIDASQSLGALPLDLAAVRPDFVVAVGYKWLLGPFSLGYLYVAEQHRAGRPLEHNWIARLGSADFTRLIDYVDDFESGSRRFDVGERSNFVLVPMALAAIEQLASWTVPAIAATIGALTDRVAAGSEGLGYVTSPRALRGPHMLGLRSVSGVPEGLAARLAQERVHVSVRGNSIRVSPHVYNTTEDVDRLLDALR